MKAVDYCRVHYETYARIRGPEGELESVNVIETADLPDFQYFECYLHYVYDKLATELADLRANQHLDNLGEPDDFDKYGGFCVLVENKFGKTIEIGMSKKQWLLMGRGEDFHTISNNQFGEGNHGFNLFECGHTDFDYDELISRDECLALVDVWLETGKMPTIAG